MSTPVGYSFPPVKGSIPVGAMLLYFGSSAPDGWLLCNGDTVDGARYPMLHAYLMKEYDSPVLPDLRGRVPVGMDNMGGTSANRVTGAWADSLGGSGGAETHTLTTGEMPSHSHVEVGVDAATGVAGVLYSTAGGAQTSVGTGSTVSNMTNVVSTQATGSGGAHNNMQPSLAVSYIIKAD